MLGYAETHFRFRVPVSLLHRSLPEMLVDAPSLAVPTTRGVPIWLVVHDAHLHPVRLDEVRILVRCGGESFRADLPCGQHLDQPFHWIPLPWPAPDVPGVQLADVVFRVTDRKGRSHMFANANLPGLPPRSIRIQRLASPFPHPRGWISGDLHVHTHWSNDPVEWGGDPEVLRAAAACMGMDFYAATDHSYDFAWESPDYLSPADPVERFSRFRASLPSDREGLPVVLPAEEVSCGNHRGENVHLLAIDHPEYLPGQGDGGRRGLRNRPDLSIPQVLEQLARSGAPAIAAHPRPGIGWLQRKIFRRGQWDRQDLSGVTGVQFCNGTWGRDFLEGRGLWVADLVAGNRPLPIAGNDAHGDLNRATQVAMPLVSLRQTESHRFGQARTWVHLDGPCDRATLRRALREGAPCHISDGPFLHLEVPGATHATERSDQAGARVVASSLGEFGNLRQLRVFAHRRGRATEDLVLERTELGAVAEETFEVEAQTLYLRAEVSTSLGRRAATRAIEPH